MATITSLEPIRSSTKARYPWTEWLDGKQRRLVKGEDYLCSTQSMQCYAYSKARERGIRVSVSIEFGGKSVLVQAVTESK